MSNAEQPYKTQYFGDGGATRYALVIFLPPELDRIAQSVRDRFDPICDAIPSHITVVFPWDTKSSVDELAALIQKELSGQKVFDVTLDSIGDFYPESPTVFWDLADCPPLVNLHYRLSGALSLTVPHARYRPHVTVAREISTHRVMLVKEKIVPYLPVEKFSVRSIDLVTPLADYRWVSVRTFNFSEI
jgi:2'-5' RNA ligase